VPESQTPPPSPRLFLVDGYALIYRAFFAMISRPLTTSKGENTSAAWGVVNFLKRLQENHKPDYIGWVHDSGLSFRHERYPAYKATREKLTEELQSDFDRGMERIRELLDAHRIPIMTLHGYEADDVIGTLARQGVEQGANVVIVSGDKDFHQLVKRGIWLLNPGRGGPASVEEQWVSEENGEERLGVPPRHVTDFLALVGDSSDNVPGVKGVGDKTARELVSTYGDLEAILAAAPSLTRKRPREALQEHAALARLSKELVTIREDLPIELDLESLRVREPDYSSVRELYVALEFHTLAKSVGSARESEQPRDPAGKTREQQRTTTPTTPASAGYGVVRDVEGLMTLVTRVRKSGHMSLDTETMVGSGVASPADPMRARIVGIAIGIQPGEAWYLPLAHRPWSPPEEAQHDLLLADAAGDRSATDDPSERGLVHGGDQPGVASLPASRSSRRKFEARSFDVECRAGKLIAAGHYEVFNLPPLDSAEMAPLRELLEDASIRKTAQNAKYDQLVLRKYGIALEGLEFDPMIASYVLDPGRRSHGLDVLALEFLDHVMQSHEELCGKGQKQLPFDVVPVELARDYVCEDADIALRLRAVFEPQLESYDLTRLMREIELPLIDVLAEMEWNGISIDLPWFASLKERFVREREDVERRIYAAAGREFNINSNPQLRQILFEELGLPILKKTATGPSTDASVLKQLAEEGHALPNLLMDYRELSKLESTYLDALPALVHPETRRLHTSFNQTVATTGRLSSSDPNLQNIPIRRELGQEIRRGFIPRAGWTLVAADYSQIELRLLAHLSADPAFVKAFRAGGDIHRQTAATIFGVPIDEVSAEMRARAKTINFATIYGQGAHALSQQLEIEFSEAKNFIATYFERFSGIRAYLDAQVAFARENGYVQTLFGRRRYIPELRDRNFNIRAFGERTAQNSPIQGSAADLIKIAMIRIHRAIMERGLESRMLLQVHDELVFEVAQGELEEMQSLVRDQMENAAELDVPLVVDVGVGENWLATKQ
jgi:DNA polymerase I